MGVETQKRLIQDLFRPLNRNWGMRDRKEARISQVTGKMLGPLSGVRGNTGGGKREHGRGKDDGLSFGHVELSVRQSQV